MAIGSTNSSMNNKIEEEITSLKNPEFTEAETRENIESKESYTTIFGKIKKYFTDLKSRAFNDPVNNLTTTNTGYALDAYQGKLLNDEITFLRWRVSRALFTLPSTLNIALEFTLSDGYTVNNSILISSRCWSTLNLYYDCCFVELTVFHGDIQDINKMSVMVGSEVILGKPVALYFIKI